MKFIEQIGKEKFTVQRSKGLGENEPEMMSLTTMNPETRQTYQGSSCRCRKDSGNF